MPARPPRRIRRRHLVDPRSSCDRRCHADGDEGGDRCEEIPAPADDDAARQHQQQSCPGRQALRVGGCGEQDPQGPERQDLRRYPCRNNTNGTQNKNSVAIATKATAAGIVGSEGASVRESVSVHAVHAVTNKAKAATIASHNASMRPPRRSVVPWVSASAARSWAASR